MDPTRLSSAVNAAARTLMVDQVTAEVVTALRARGVEPILLKGPSFARWLYTADVLRPYVDTDLLVAPDQQRTAEDVLLSLGFLDLMVKAAAAELDDHSRTFHRRRAGGGDDEVDLHFTLAGARSNPAAVWAALSGDLEHVDVAGTIVTGLGVSGRAMQVVLHAAQDGRVTDQPSTDLQRALAVASLATWRSAAALATELDAVAAFVAGLSSTPGGHEVLASLGLSGHAGGAFERLRAASPPPMSLGIARLFERSDRRGLALELFREVVPTPAFMRLWSPMARRGPLGLAAAYTWRPVSLLIRLAPAVRAYLRARRTPNSHS
ncbi:MAG: nucleotidyltransferase family protein [Actinomycetota bacterium]